MNELKREVLVITHSDVGSDVSWINLLVRQRGMEPVLVRPFAGEALPEPGTAVGVICLGGPQSAYELAAYPFLVDEQEFLRRAIGEEVPVLAICLGSQLLASALGGKAIAGANGLEAGLIDVEVVPELVDTESLSLGGRYFSFHSDSFELPPQAELLATSDKYPQAWRIGSGLALQFHPDLSPEGVRGLLSVEEDKLRSSGFDIEAVIAEAESQRETAWDQAERVIGGWLNTTKNL
jgi:GMP synthase (glutamine-hydrolysing)